MRRYNTYTDWAVVLRPIISVCLPFIDRIAPLGRAAEFDLKVAVCSQSISSLLAFRKAWRHHARQAVLDASWRISGRTINSLITVLIGLGALDELAKHDLHISGETADIN